MGTAEEVDSFVASGLVVSDLDENVVVPLREVYSRPTMPVSKDELSQLPEEAPTLVRGSSVG